MCGDLADSRDRTSEQCSERLPQARIACDGVENAGKGHAGGEWNRRRHTTAPRPERLNDGVGEAPDGSLEIGRRVAVREHGVEERPHRVLDDGAHERGAIAKVDVEGAARVAGARADGVEARGVEPVRGELGEGGGDQGRPRGLRRVGARVPAAVCRGHTSPS